MINLTKVRKFINREKLYFYLLSVIIIFNALMLISPDRSEREAQKAEKLASLEQLEIQPEEFQRLVEEGDPYAVGLASFMMLAFLAFAVGLVLAIRFIYAKAKRQSREIKLQAHPTVNWTVFSCFKVAILFLWFGYVLHFIEGSIFAVLNITEPNEELVMMMNAAIMDILAFFFVGYFLIKEFGHTFSGLGLSLKNLAGKIGLGIVSYLSALPGIVLVVIIVLGVAKLLNYQPKPQEIFKVFYSPISKRLLVFSTIFVAVGGPVAEEFFFRGFFYPALRKRLGIAPAMWVVSGVFALLHSNLVGFFPIMVLGILLAWLYQRTGSLIPSITAHVIHNSAIVTMVLLTRELVMK